MFSEQEQEEIINQFLDVIKVQDYITNSKLKRKNCKCNDYKKHDRYCVLNQMPLPESILNNIYGFTYRCYHCDKKVEAEEELKERIETNDLCLYNVDKLILSASESFPCYDIVQRIVPNIKQKRYKMYQELFDKMMCCSDKQEIKNWIEIKKYAIYNTRMDFNKIMHICFKNVNFDLLE